MRQHVATRCNIAQAGFEFQMGQSNAAAAKKEIYSVEFQSSKPSWKKSPSLP
jgi:hypothetical protein